MSMDRHVVVVPKLASVEDVVDIGRRLAQGREAGTGVLDLAALSTGSAEQDRHKRIGIHAAFLLAQLLVTHYRSMPLRVHLPRTPSLMTQLVRGGILFALAHHDRLEAGSWDGVGDHARSIWSRRWVATEGIGQLELFRQSLPAGENADLTAFIDVHQSPGSVVDSELVGNGVRPWLRRRALELGIELGPFEAVHADVERSVGQLVDNIRLHADLALGGASLVELAITRGRRDHLYLAVLDAGIGVPTSVSKRLHGQEPASTELVRDALLGRLPLYDRDRARGLSVVRDIARRHDGSLFLATGGGSDLPEDTAVIWRSHPSSDGDVKVVEGLPIAGTLVVVDVPMPQPEGPDTGLVDDERLPDAG